MQTLKAWQTLNIASCLQTGSQYVKAPFGHTDTVWVAHKTSHNARLLAKIG